LEAEANDFVPFLDILVIKSGPKLAMKIYWKPIHAGRYLHFKSNHQHHMKRVGVYSFISRAKVIYQDQKDFNNEIKNTQHDLMLNE
jgi:hypothetical protein